MSINSTIHKSASLCFRGFEQAPAQIELMVGVPATKVGLKGNQIKPGVQTTWKKSVAKFTVEFPHGCGLDEMIPKMLSHLGGVQHLCEVRNAIRPEFFEIDITLPIKNSEEQEGGFFPPEVLGDLNQLGVTLSFQFL